VLLWLGFGLVGLVVCFVLVGCVGGCSGLLVLIGLVVVLFVGACLVEPEGVRSCYLMRLVVKDIG